MKFHAGLLTGTPCWTDRFEVAVLAHTPGVPVEWIYAAFGLEWRRRRSLLKLIAATDTEEYHELGRINAESVVPGDGWAMLVAVAPKYAGAVPLAAQLELQGGTRSDGAVAEALGVSRSKVQRWRTRSVFCPLTGVRLVPNRGTRVDVPKI